MLYNLLKLIFPDDTFPVNLKLVPLAPLAPVNNKFAIVVLVADKLPVVIPPVALTLTALVVVNVNELPDAVVKRIFVVVTFVNDARPVDTLVVITFAAVIPVFNLKTGAVIAVVVIFANVAVVVVTLLLETFVTIALGAVIAPLNITLDPDPFVNTTLGIVAFVINVVPVEISEFTNTVVPLTLPFIFVLSGLMVVIIILPTVALFARISPARLILEAFADNTPVTDPLSNTLLPDTFIDVTESILPDVAYMFTTFVFMSTVDVPNTIALVMFTESREIPVNMTLVNVAFVVAILALETLVLAYTVPILEVDICIVDVVAELNAKFALDKLVITKLFVDTPVAFIEDVVTLVPKRFTAVPFVNTAFVALIVPVDMLVDASTVPVVRPVVSPNVVPLAVVKVALLTLLFVVITFAVVADVAEIESARTELVARNEPLTSNVLTGTVVLIPTFPPVVKIDPRVFELPTTDNAPDICTVDAVTFVSTTFVAVTDATETVPAAKFPDIEIDPPVIVVPLTIVDDNVLTVADDTCTDPAVNAFVNTADDPVTFVNTLFVAVNAVEATFAVDTLVDASNVPVVTPVLKTNVDPDTFVAIAFVTVALDDNSDPVDTLDAARVGALTAPLTLRVALDADVNTPVPVEAYNAFADAVLTFVASK